MRIYDVDGNVKYFVAVHHYRDYGHDGYKNLTKSRFNEYKDNKSISPDAIIISDPDAIIPDTDICRRYHEDMHDRWDDLISKPNKCQGGTLVFVYDREYYKDNGHFLLSTGVSFLSHLDRFDRKKGLKIALNRAFDQLGFKVSTVKVERVLKSDFPTDQIRTVKETRYVVTQITK